jgi:hypothetical protein
MFFLKLNFEKAKNIEIAYNFLSFKNFEFNIAIQYKYKRITLFQIYTFERGNIYLM